MEKHGRIKMYKKIIVFIMAILIIAIIVYTNIIMNNRKSINKNIENEAKRMMNEENMYLVEAKIDKDTEEIVRVPVPNGYVASSVESEKVINEGFVIYEGQEAVTSENLEEARKTRNQYVWIPVSEEKLNEMYGIDSNGKKWGKLYNFNSSGKKALNWKETDNVFSISSNNNYREPDILKSEKVHESDSNDMIQKLQGITQFEFLEQLEREFELCYESIATYGGFYIGRYETGDLSKKELVVVQMNTDLGSQQWYNVYPKIDTLEGDKENISISMIWGNQWDATIEWLVETETKTYLELTNNDIAWGNYYENAIEYINVNGEISTTVENEATRIPSGASETTKANNIYDLAGNVWDWTMEAAGSNRNCRTYRGGSYGKGGNYPASARTGQVPYTDSTFFGFRVMMYIK